MLSINIRMHIIEKSVGDVDALNWQRLIIRSFPYTYTIYMDAKNSLFFSFMLEECCKLKEVFFYYKLVLDISEEFYMHLLLEPRNLFVMSMLGINNKNYFRGPRLV